MRCKYKYIRSCTDRRVLVRSDSADATRFSIPCLLASPVNKNTWLVRGLTHSYVVNLHIHQPPRVICIFMRCSGVDVSQAAVSHQRLVDTLLEQNWRTTCKIWNILKMWQIYTKCCTLKLFSRFYSWCFQNISIF